jgi:hypothetical protein
MRLFEIVATMGDLPDKGGLEMNVGARHRFFSALERAFCYQKSRF